MIMRNIAYNIIGGVTNMVQFVGIDPNTGYEMYVDNNSNWMLKLPKCPCCGGEELLSYPVKYQGEHVCADCGAKWAAYLSGRSRLNIRSSHRAIINQLSRIQHWLRIKQAGGLAPGGLERDYANLKSYMDMHNIPEVLHSEVATNPGRCAYCGVEADVPVGVSRPKCPECESRYKRYRYLQTHIGTLDIEQCEEFNSILDDYVDLMWRGYWAPNIPKYRAKIKQRISDITD